ncbi:hypothetical protein AAGG74_14680 [Bacillus mexicanus]|uniref:hypothetical protein n=1 Tax=Bacillus mexicanus TaxID=2834415 RepID=UPI003D263322
MIDLLVGKTKMGKTTFIKEIVQNKNEPVILLDFKNDYDDIKTKSINLGLIDPFLSLMDYKDSIAINAGLIQYSQFLKVRSEEVLKDYSSSDNWSNYKMHNLIDESIKRATNGWDQNENMKAKESRRYLSFKKSKQTQTLEKEIEKIEHNDIVVVKTEGLHSVSTRVLSFLLLNRLQQKFPSITVVSDNINYLWRDGHLFLFSQIFDFEKNNMIFSFNKTENFPKSLKRLIDNTYIFRLESNSDVEFFNELNIPIDSSSKRLRKYKYIEHKSSLVLS